MVCSSLELTQTRLSRPTHCSAVCSSWLWASTEAEMRNAPPSGLNCLQGPPRWSVTRLRAMYGSGVLMQCGWRWGVGMGTGGSMSVASLCPVLSPNIMPKSVIYAVAWSRIDVWPMLRLSSMSRSKVILQPRSVLIWPVLTMESVGMSMVCLCYSLKLCRHLWSITRNHEEAPWSQLHLTVKNKEATLAVTLCRPTIEKEGHGRLL